MNLIALGIKHTYQAIFLHNLNLKLLFCNIRLIKRTLIRGEGTLYNIIIDVMYKVKGRAHIRTQLRNRSKCA